MVENNRIFKSVKMHMTNKRIAPQKINTGILSRPPQHKSYQCLKGGTA